MEQTVIFIVLATATALLLADGVRAATRDSDGGAGQNEFTEQGEEGFAATGDAAPKAGRR